MTIDQFQTTDYQKAIRLQASVSAVFDALTTVTSLGSWWTRATGSGEASGELRFFFDSPTEPCVMRVVLEWVVRSGFVDGWVEVICPVEGGGSELHFRHHGLTPELECIEMCTLGWNTYLASLRQYVESGHGRPFGS